MAKKTKQPAAKKDNSRKTANPIKGNKPFPKGVSGNPKGRPRKLVSTMIDEMRAAGVEPLKQSQIIDAYETIFNMTIAEVKEKALDENQPVFIRIIAKAMLSQKGQEMLEKMLDRAHGRVKQSVDLTTKGQPIVKKMDLSKLSTKDLIALNELAAKIGD